MPRPNLVPDSDANPPVDARDLATSATSAFVGSGNGDQPLEPGHNSESEATRSVASMFLPSSTSFRWSPTALAFSDTTPSLAQVLFPALCLATHGLFLYGQLVPMWQLRINANIDTWANATGSIARNTFYAVGLDYDNNLTYQQELHSAEFTYYFAIHHLWEAKGIPGKLLPRVAAVFLIMLSGIWPHMKLAWLQFTWFFSKQASSRTTTLQWLSTLGKWSLADVLVVCIMVGVLNIDWVVNPGEIKNGIISDLPAILQIIESMYDEQGLCNKLLKVHCEAAKKVATKTKCSGCTKLVHEAYTRPDWAQSTGASILNGVDTSGDGLVTMRVVGMRGIYAFCGAVIFSILLSLMVDIFDHWARRESRKQQERTLGQERIQRLMIQQEQPEPQASPVDRSAEDALQEPLLGSSGPSPLEVDLGEEEDWLVSSSSLSRSKTIFSGRFFLSTLLTVAFVMFAVDWETMDRKVSGAGPDLLHDILGVDWERTYSLRTLMWTTGAHGGWDYMLMGTFGLFIVIGPVIRAVLLLAVALLDRCRLGVEAVAKLVNFIGAFCAWEVYAIAIVMVQMLMPTITTTILKNKLCNQLSDDGTCLLVEFNILPYTFWTIVAGGAMLVAVSCVAVARGTDRDATVSSPARRIRNHNYERLQGDDSGMNADEQLHELVFETNQV